VPRVVVVGLGPAGPDLLTASAQAAIDRLSHRYVRTARHPAAAALPDARSFDDAYEASESFDEVYARIVDALVEAASEHGEVLYAVPGSPMVAERTVELLRDDDRVDVELVPGMSFVDLAWDRLGVDPVAEGVRLIDGRRFAVDAAGERGPMLVVQCDAVQVLSDVKLSVETAPAEPVVVLQRLGTPDESVRRVEWSDLDREVEPDHLTTLYIPQLTAPVAVELVRFAELVRELRARCPWDREQTHRSLTRHLLEETYETLEAIEAIDDQGYGPLEEELGDLLFQVAFHATLAAEQGAFTLADVARNVHDKLVHRHPHVFGEVAADTPGQVMQNWEQIKKAEKGRESIMDGIPGDLPSLLHAHKVQRKAATVGFDWPSAESVYPKVLEELDEVRADPSDEEVGDLLFAVVNLARHLDVDPEAALRSATAKFRDRFRSVERLAAERGLDLPSMDLPALDALWDEVKAQPPRGS
jgi:tetrapyrrole methylase family protein/MazG family protein